MSLFWPTGNKDTTQLDRRLILKSLHQLKAEKMLDTGAGPCNLTQQMARAVGSTEVYAIDMQPPSKGCRENSINFIQGDLNERLPYKDSSFDLITSIHTIEHLTDTDQYLAEIYRVLKPGGYLFIATVNLAALHYRLMLLFGFLPNCLAPSRHKISPFKGEHGKNPHKSVFTHKALMEITSKHGFQLINGISHTIYTLPTPLANLICKFWPNVGLYSHLLLQKQPPGTGPTAV